MSHRERTIGDPKGATRRQVVKGAITLAIAAFLSTGIGGLAVSLYEKGKRYILHRTGGLYTQDVALPVRVSHRNPEIVSLYREFLSPGTVQPATTDLSHRLLHTTYGDKVPALIEELHATPVSVAQAETDEIMARIIASRKED